MGKHASKHTFRLTHGGACGITFAYEVGQLFCEEVLVTPEMARDLIKWLEKRLKNIESH